MPNRMIRESARTSETLDQLSDGAERMFWRLTTVADDFGRFEANPRVLLAACFPLKAGRLKVEQIEKWLRELILVELVVTYRVEGKMFGVFKTWNKHQRVRAQHSKYPAPTDDNICCQVTADVPVVVVEVTEDTERRETKTSGAALNGGPPSPISLAREIIDFLNAKAGRSYRGTPDQLAMIRARLADGIQPWQLKAIVSRKVHKWKGDPKMDDYLRPETLFNKTKCESYLGELPPPAEEEPDV